MILHHKRLTDAWSRLDQAVVSGGPVKRLNSEDNEEKIRENFLMGMFNNAMLLAPLVVKEIDLTSRSRLLDLGGGPGTYAVHFCLKNPNLKAVVYDLATSRQFAEKIIKNFGLSDRISFTAGNYLEEDIPGRYDTAWLSHILHSEGPENCQRIISKVISTIDSGGMILIHDFLLNDTLDGPLFPALFSQNMLVNTYYGRSYSERQIMEFLNHCGVKRIRRLGFKGHTQSGIIAATV